MLVKIAETPLHIHLFRKKFLKSKLRNQNVGEDWGHGNTWALLVEIQTDVASSKSSLTVLSKVCVCIPCPPGVPFLCTHSSET